MMHQAPVRFVSRGPYVHSAPPLAKTGQPEITGAPCFMAKSMMLWRFWIAKPSANREIACGGLAAIAVKAAPSSSCVRVGK